MVYSPSFTATGIPGAGLPSRYVGATPGGAPASGQFEVGDFVIDRSGDLWVCTAAGTPGTWASAGGSGVLTTAGDMLIENATPAPARLPVGSAGQVLGVSGGLPAWGTGMTLLATTTATGYTLVNGTGNILTWTAPNDGNMHRVLLVGELVVASTETGGKITVSFTDPAGGSHSAGQVYANALGSGSYQLPGANTAVLTLIQANTAYTIAQAVALSGGAAVFYGELWGS